MYFPKTFRKPLWVPSSLVISEKRKTAVGSIFTGHEPVRVPSSLVMSEKVKIGPTAVSG